MSNATIEPLEAGTVRAALVGLHDANGGVLTAKAVVDAARPEDSILHRFFTWNDPVAGERWRLHQAGILIRRVKLTITRPDLSGPKKVVIQVHRQFESLPSDRPGYRTIETIVGKRGRRAELVAMALAELEAVRRRFSDLEELAGVWEALSKARSKRQ